MMFYKFRILIATLFMFCFTIHCTAGPGSPKPRIVVGIVVDQMRYDYITRYWNKFGENGFKKMIRDGYNCSNAHYNFVPTYTGPGHASIYTGTTPAVHGIIGNDWYSRQQGRNIYVTEDQNVTGTGTTSISGNMSPVQLLTTTMTDELRLFSNLRSKVISISLKDRSAILSAGHAANAAYWFEPSSGNWISSSWYLKSLPDWVTNFNNLHLPAEYLKKPWIPLLPVSSYDESTADDSRYEDVYTGETSPVFPHNFSAQGAVNFQFVKSSPYGNQLTKEFALSAMRSEELGKDDYTDFLAISFSSPDYIGHQFGTHSIETEDNYLRFDQDLAELISAVETYAGKGNALFFLTADHAAIPNILFLADQKIPAGQFNIAAINDSLQKHLNTKFSEQKWVITFDNDQVYLDHQLLEKNKISIAEMTGAVSDFLMGVNGVSNVLSSKELSVNEYTWGIRSMVQKGFYPKRSGDVVMILEPGLIEYKLKGTTHGAGYTYDTHVPLLFYGWNIHTGATSRQIDITDIAPTISQMLGMQSPSGCTGKAITEISGK